MTRTKSWMALGAAGVLGAAALTGTALAQDGGSTPPEEPGVEAPDTAPDTAPDAARGPGMWHAGEHREDFTEAVAEELGIGVEELEDAVEAAKDELFEQHLQERVDAGDITEDEADELRQAYADGTLREVMAERRLEHLEERLQERVAAGELSQEEADEILERARARAEEGHPFGPRGRHHGPGGPRGGPGLGQGPGPGQPSVRFDARRETLMS